MKRELLYSILIIFLIILQLTIKVLLPDIGLVPDFLLIITIISAIVGGRKQGMIAGFFTGIIQDVFSFGSFGVYTLLKLLLGFVFGFMETHFFRENFVIPPLTVFLGTLIQEFLVILLNENLIFAVNYFSVLIEVILPLAGINALVGFIFYVFYYYYDRAGGQV